VERAISLAARKIEKDRGEQRRPHDVNDLAEEKDVHRVLRSRLESYPLSVNDE
jgi:hypothetical protein